MGGGRRPRTTRYIPSNANIDITCDGSLRSHWVNALLRSMFHTRVDGGDVVLTLHS